MTRSVMVGAVSVLFASSWTGLEGQAGRGSTLEGMFGEPTFILLHPSVAVRQVGTERRLDGEVGWELEEGGWKRAFGLVFGTADHLASYTWSGAHLSLDREGEALRPGGRIAVRGASGEGPDGSVELELGLSRRSATLEVGSKWLRGMPTHIGDHPRGTGQGPSWDHHVDAELTVGRDLARAHLEVRSGIRFGAVTPGPSQWAHAGISLPIGRGFGIAMRAGIRPDGPEKGRIGGRFIEMGGILRLGRSRPVPEAVSRIPALRAEALEPGTYILTVEAWGASAVELRGDLTDWETVALGQLDVGDHLWKLSIHRPPGVYHVTVRIDGGDWLVPRGLIPVPDRFGGTTGLLELPAAGEDGDGLTEPDLCGSDGDGGCFPGFQGVSIPEHREDLIGLAAEHNLAILPL